MEEQKTSLQRAITALPSYEAPPFVWEEINVQLDQDHQDQIIKETIPQLAAYEAPTMVWEGIENTLDKPASTKLVSLFNWKQLTKIAAGLLLLLSIGYGLWPSDQTEVSYTAHTEPIDQYLLEADWDADEATFAQVVKLHEEYSKTFKDTESASLKAELQELEEARKELKTAIELYGNDHELIRQLAALERDRTQVIKQMAFKI